MYNQHMHDPKSHDPFEIFEARPLMTSSIGIDLVKIAHLHDPMLLLTIFTLHFNIDSIHFTISSILIYLPNLSGV